MDTLPLFHYPGRRLWVDDDVTLLKMMMFSFGEDNINTFNSARECLAYVALKSNEENPSDILINNLINFDTAEIRDLSNNLDLDNEITVMIIDYNMPEMDGISLAKATSHLPIQKILLSGNIQDAEITLALKHNIIQRFVQKGESQMHAKLTDSLNTLAVDYFKQKTKPLMSQLKTESRLALSDKGFIEFFNEFCASNSIKEYYFVEKQGGFLCIDEEGKSQFLPVQLREKMNR